MIENDFSLNCVGFVTYPYKNHGVTQRQGQLKVNLSKIAIKPEFYDAYDELFEGDDLVIFCWFDRVKWTVLKLVKSCDESNPITEVFTIRSPNKPNHISRTVVNLSKSNKTSSE